MIDILVLLLLQNLIIIGILIESKSIKNKINSVIQEIGDIRLDLVKLNEKIEDLEELIMYY